MKDAVTLSVRHFIQMWQHLKRTLEDTTGHTTDDMMVAVVRAGLHNTRDRRRAEGHLII